MSISKIFSKEIEITILTEDFEIANELANQKIFELELKYRQMKAQDLKNVKESDSFVNYPQLKWKFKLKQNVTLKNLYEATFTVEGLKKAREINIIKWFRINEN